MANAQAELKDLQEQIKSLKDELAAQARSSVNGNNIRDIASQAGQTAGAYYSEAKDKAAVTKESCEQTIASRPFASVAAAFLGGAALALILKK